MPQNSQSKSNSNFVSEAKLYEIWLFVLLLIKGYGMQFDIGKEIKIANKFDDAALKYRNEHTQMSRYIFCQVNLVHNGKDKVLDKEVLLGKKQISFDIDDFNLKKYFSSYLKIRNQFKRTDNVLSKLIIYSTVSDLHKNLKLAKNIDDQYDHILSAKNQVCRYFINPNSEDGQHIVRELKKVQTDYNQLIDLLFKYTDEEYASRHPMNYAKGSLMDYYHNALVDNEVLTVWTDSKNNVTKCGFHENFQNHVFESSETHQIFYDLRNKSSLHSDDFTNYLKSKSWIVWKSFGKKPKGNKSLIVQQLPTIENVSEGDVLNFLNILEFKLGEPNLDELSQVVKDQFEMSKLFGLSDAVGFVSDKTERFIKDWRNTNCQTDEWIKQKDKLFSDFKNDISKTWTPSLVTAAEKGRIEDVKLLIARGAKVNTADLDGHTPLHAAIWKNHIEVVKFLVANTADVNALDNCNQTPLFVAAYFGNIDIVKFLVRKNADLTACNKDNQTPLQVAKMRNHTEVVNFLHTIIKAYRYRYPV